MTPITPSGTRILPTRIPLGCSRNSLISPTGSGSFATCSRPCAMLSMLFSVSVRRSMNAASLPTTRAPFASSAFAARSFFASRRAALAAATSARFLVAVSARASSRDAAPARRPWRAFGEFPGLSRTRGRLLEFAEEPVDSWQVIVVIVDREYDCFCVPDDLPARDEPADSRIGAVVPVVAQHQIVALRNLDRAE